MSTSSLPNLIAAAFDIMGTVATVPLEGVTDSNGNTVMVKMRQLSWREVSKFQTPKGGKVKGRDDNRQQLILTLAVDSLIEPVISHEDIPKLPISTAMALVNACLKLNKLTSQDEAAVSAAEEVANDTKNDSGETEHSVSHTS